MEQLTNEERKKFEDLETRTFALEYERAEGEEDERRVSFSFASEEPVLRSFGWEVLSHKSEDIDLDFFDSSTYRSMNSVIPSVVIKYVGFKLFFAQKRMASGLLFTATKTGG